MIHPNSTSLKFQKKVIHNLTFTITSKFHNFLSIVETYRFCYNVENLYDSAGKFLKTLCYVHEWLTYDTFNARCSDNKMLMANLNTTDLVTAAMNYTNLNYNLYNPGYSYIGGKNGSNCKVVTNYLRAANSYTIVDAPCNIWRFGICEYDPPAQRSSHEIIYEENC
jgi:hypothetical protein